MPERTVLIVEDHAILRDGLRALMQEQGGFEVVGECDNGHDAVHLAVQLQPDLVLMDISMPRRNGTEAIPLIRHRLPETKIIVLTMHKTDEYVRASFAAGANGFVLKEDSHSELRVAIEKVFSEHTYISSGVCEQVVSGFLSSQMPTSTSQEQPVSWDQLTPREREILKLVAGGKRNKEVAVSLSISIKTVEKHRASLMSKLGARNVSDLTAFAIKKGLV